MAQERNRQVPVLMIIFNRPDTTQKVFEAVREAKPARLYVAGDAPRADRPDDEAKCTAARKIIERVDWDCEVHTLFQETNVGCSLGPRAAFDWFFTHEEEGIILEDDCVPNISFFDFCAEMLERYRHDERIISINGSNLGYKLQNGDSYTFSRFMNMWGWATWRRSAQAIDYYMHGWQDEKRPLWHIYKNMRQNLFDMDLNWYAYWKQKFDITVDGRKVTWWDWQWVYHQTEHKQLSVVPGVNLVTNIGFQEDATHTHEVGNPAANIPVFPLKFPLVHPKSKRPDNEYEENHVKWVWSYYRRLPRIFYVKRYVRTVLSRLKNA